MVFGHFDENDPRYERQFKNVRHLVLNTIREKKKVYIDMDELEKILEALHEWRVIE